MGRIYMMTKQEEIREGLKKLIGEVLPVHSYRQSEAVYSYRGDKDFQDLIIDYLHSQGVVIKDERIPPNTIYCHGEIPDIVQYSVEPLIEGD